MPQTSPDFIFMLTNQDRTVADAAERLKDVLAAGIMHVGFKDIGLPFDELLLIASAIKAAGATLYLEVVSLDEESERRSAQAAVDLGVDILMGGTGRMSFCRLLPGRTSGTIRSPARSSAIRASSKGRSKRSWTVPDS